jgi:hypothetical protein
MLTTSRTSVPAARLRCTVWKRREQYFTARALTGSGKHQAMIPVVIVIALLSLLVATEPEHVDGTAPTPEPPLRPAGKKSRAEPAQPDRLAA